MKRRYVYIGAAASLAVLFTGLAMWSVPLALFLTGAAGLTASVMVTIR